MKSISGKRSDKIMIIRYACFSLLLFIFTLVSTNAQQDKLPSQPDRARNEIPPLKERIFFGGSLGLQFGTFTDIEVSPIVGLWVLPRIGIAVGPNFHYVKNPFYRTTIYGGKTYAEYIFLQDLNNIIPLGLHVGLFLHLEDEVLSLESDVFRDPHSSGRFLINTILAGGGIRQPIGQRSSLNIIFLWTLNNDLYGIYSNPEIRVSVVF